MGNFIRAFCVGEEVPPITKVVQWLATRDVHVRVENGDPMKMQSRGWEQVSLIYKEGKLPIIARCSRTDAKGDASAGALAVQGPGAQAALPDRAALAAQLATAD